MAEKNRNNQPTQRDEHGEKIHCTAFCPKCGSDLYYHETFCICKNKKCNWTCEGCSTTDDLDSLVD